MITIVVVFIVITMMVMIMMMNMIISMMIYDDKYKYCYDINNSDNNYDNYNDSKCIYYWTFYKLKLSNSIFYKIHTMPLTIKHPLHHTTSHHITLTNTFHYSIFHICRNGFARSSCIHQRLRSSRYLLTQSSRNVWIHVPTWYGELTVVLYWITF